MLKRTVLYIFQVIIVVGLLIISIEGIGRIVIHVRYGMPGKSYGLWQYDRELGATHSRNAYNTHTSLNDQGFRNKEDVFTPKPDDSLRIIAFGGSTTFGYNLLDGETYTEKLEIKLRQIPGYEKTQVLNAGRICYSAGHNLILMKRLIPRLRPDYVIIYEGVNEEMNSYILRQDGVSMDSLSGAYGVIGKSYDQNRWLKRNSVIVRFVDYRVKQYLMDLRPKNTTQTNKKVEISSHPWTIENYKVLLKEMLTFLQKENVTPIVIRYASADNSGQEMFSNISSDIAKENNVFVYDVRPHFDKTGERDEDLFIYTGVHVTPLGAELMASGLNEIIFTDLKVKNP